MRGLNEITGRSGFLFLASCLLGLLPACRSFAPSSYPAPVRLQVVELALKLVDAPYRYGGTDIDGFDCSGFVWYVFNCFGVDLPRSAREQARMKRKIRFEQARAGDILAFKLEGKWHTGIYVGDGRFVHAPNRNGSVRLETVSAYWRRRLVAVIDRLR